jgi:hypothetical protein
MCISPTIPGRLDLMKGLKRKVGYEDEEIKSTRERLGRMDIDNASDNHDTTASPSRSEVM